MMPVHQYISFKKCYSCPYPLTNFVYQTVKFRLIDLSQDHFISKHNDFRITK